MTAELTGLACPSWCTLPVVDHDVSDVVSGQFAGCMVVPHERALPGLVVDGDELVGFAVNVDDVSWPTAAGTVTDRTPPRLLMFTDGMTELTADLADQLAGVLSEVAVMLRRLGADR